MTSVLDPCFRSQVRAFITVGIAAQRYPPPPVTFNRTKIRTCHLWRGRGLSAYTASQLR